MKWINQKTVKVVEYHWGELSNIGVFSIDELKEMEVLDEFDLLGFDLREEDRDLVFVADSYHIYRDDDGVSVKYAYGVESNILNNDIEVIATRPPKPTTPPAAGYKWVFDEASNVWITVPEDTETQEVKPIASIQTPLSGGGATPEYPLGTVDDDRDPYPVPDGDPFPEQTRMVDITRSSNDIKEGDIVRLKNDISLENITYSKGVKGKVEKKLIDGKEDKFGITLSIAGSPTILLSLEDIEIIDK